MQLDDRGQAIKDGYKNDHLTTKEAVQARISVMYLEANQLQCPKTEVDRVIADVQENTFKALANRKHIEYGRSTRR